MPPQAYTREVLATAFDWLSRQPENIKKSIRTSDDLVGLYLKSNRHKDSQSGFQNGAQPNPNHLNSNPQSGADLSSAKNFRNELQGLALNLKQFEDKSESTDQIVSDPPAVSDYLHELNLMMSTQASQVQIQPHVVSQKSNEIIPESADTVLFKLDKKTVTAINLAKERLNLSSNTEAIRVLISLGEKHLRKIFGTEE